MKLSAVIFDLDGLLTDTETLHMVSYQRVLQGHHIRLLDQEYIDHWINNGLGIAEFVERRSLKLDYQQLRNEKAVVFHALLPTELRPMPYAQEILRHLHGTKPLALASASSRDNVEVVVRQLKMERYFDVILTGSEVQSSKPSPEIFLAAAARLGVAPGECIVLEDAWKGVIAANRARMRVIAVPNAYTIGSDFSTADAVCDSLQDAEKLLLER